MCIREPSLGRGVWCSNEAQGELSLCWDSAWFSEGQGPGQGMQHNLNDQVRLLMLSPPCKSHEGRLRSLERQAESHGCPSAHADPKCGNAM